jgi:hypothetical protein
MAFGCRRIRGDHRGRFDRIAYATHLFGSRYRSPSARYARLINDIRNDTTRLPQFFEAAARVLDIDNKRRKSLAYVSSLSMHERNEALRRIYTNKSIVSLVRAKLGQRVASYRFVLERLVITTPSPQTVDVEREPNHLQAKIAYYRNHTAPHLGACTEPGRSSLINRISLSRRAGSSLLRPRVLPSASDREPALARGSQSGR